jgi:hypothetical protein
VYWSCPCKGWEIMDWAQAFQDAYLEASIELNTAADKSSSYFWKESQKLCNLRIQEHHPHPSNRSAASNAAALDRSQK